FTPGSAPNEILKINRRGDATLKYFRIYNRWGTKVFETTDINEGWDGKYKGSVQPMGVYIYMIDATTQAGKHFYKQGNVTLIR
ncbi:MAG TPA: gliding motility-associated C-terminal domain-containing protein, partial [Flavipsychrobacter sp.]|nr:gliding motility-associated C-terminal domain-containing protein [Flavipsychrobacter sp.]